VGIAGRCASAWRRASSEAAACARARNNDKEEVLGDPDRRLPHAPGARPRGAQARRRQAAPATSPHHKEPAREHVERGPIDDGAWPAWEHVNCGPVDDGACSGARGGTDEASSSPDLICLRSGTPRGHGSMCSSERASQLRARAAVASPHSSVLARRRPPLAGACWRRPSLRSSVASRGGCRER
jgi:hypothetical protein